MGGWKGDTEKAAVSLGAASACRRQARSRGSSEPGPRASGAGPVAGPFASLVSWGVRRGVARGVAGTQGV